MVNNMLAAVYLVFRTLAPGKEVLVTGENALWEELIDVLTYYHLQEFSLGRELI